MSGNEEIFFNYEKNKAMRKRSLKKYILGGESFFSHDLNRMSQEGDVVLARKNFIKKRFKNLDFLLKHRFEWMNKYLEDKKDIIEIGAGAGFSKFYINKEYTLTDIVETPWLDKKIDAQNTGLPDSSIDAVITSHSIHHFSKPMLFFYECERILKPEGIILIQEINTSLFLRILLKIMRHEGWSYNIDVYNDNEVVNDPKAPWSATCAVPEVIFEEPDKFNKKFSSLKIVLDKKNESLILPLSGGVISKIDFPELPYWFLNMVYFLDKILIKIAPNIFAVGRSILIKKSK